MDYIVLKSKVSKKFQNNVSDTIVLLIVYSKFMLWKIYNIRYNILEVVISYFNHLFDTQHFLINIKFVCE